MDLVYTLRRGANGLGIDVDTTNTIVVLLPAGQASADGAAAVGDVVLGIDGVALNQRRLPAVMPPGRPEYELVVPLQMPVAIGGAAAPALALAVLANLRCFS